MCLCMCAICLDVYILCIYIYICSSIYIRMDRMENVHCVQVALTLPGGTRRNNGDAPALFAP